MLLTLSLLLLLLHCSFKGVAGDDIMKITNVNDFINFVSNVNSGTNYSGTTVFLDSDITLTEGTDPIGNDTSNYFHGTFDGKGHVISGLVITSSSLIRTGLFGYSDGLTIKNVVLDSSCSITNTYNSDFDVFVGGIIGECYAKSGGCSIENSVNMAAVKFSGNINNALNLGGIIGTLRSLSYNAYVKNCVNYGSITHSGSVGYAELGGITGYSEGSSSTYARNYIQNSLNYGTITHSGTSSCLTIGGIAGNSSSYTYIENCVSAGKISILTTASSIDYVGSIVGYVYIDISINYCYYTTDVGVSSINGGGTPSSTTGTPDSATGINSELVGNLNAKATSYIWNKWLLNINRKTMAFTINRKTSPITMNTQIILLPSLVSEGGMQFDGWYGNSECTKPLELSEVTEDTTFYGLYGVIVVVTFDANGGDSTSFTSKKVVLNSAYGALPEATREGYAFSGWFTQRRGGSEVTSSTIFTSPPSDHTLYAQWIISNYTLTFDFGNGAEKEVRIVDFNSSVVYPPNPEREGYTFMGWDKGNVEFMPAHDLIITAQWRINSYDLTFIIGDWTEITIVTDFNSTIEYPPDPERKGYIFIGWDKSDIEFMPAHDLTITALWEKSSYTTSSSASPVLIIVIAVPTLLAVIIIAIAVFMLIHRKLKREKDIIRKNEMDKPLVAPPPKGSYFGK